MPEAERPGGGSQKELVDDGQTENILIFSGKEFIV
jgi:hypothetical protein